MNVSVVSLKFIKNDGSPVDYVMVEGEDVDPAVLLAAKWAETNVSRTFDKIVEHQGIINVPEFHEFDVIDGVRIWNLPF